MSYGRKHTSATHVELTGNHYQEIIKQAATEHV